MDPQNNAGQTTSTAPAGATAAPGGGAQPTAGAGQVGGQVAGGAPAAGGTTPAADAKGSTQGSSTTGEGAAPAGGEAQKGKDGGQGADGAAAKAKDGGQAGELEVKLPEGVKVDEQRLGKFKEVAQKAGMTSDQASAVAAMYVEMQQSEVSSWQDQGKKWGEQLKADKDFGGTNYDASVAAAQKAVLEFGGRELADELEKYGIGNLPALARAFARVGKSMADDSNRLPRAPTGEVKPTGAQRTARMYDNPDSHRARGDKQ